MSSQDMEKANKLATLIGNTPNIKQPGVVQKQVQQKLGSVGASTSDAPVMTNLVSAELINQGKIGPNTGNSN